MIDWLEADMIDSLCVMEKPLLSVIVPVYNTAPWLGRCLDSICAQTYRNLEILCVNDGSTDNSAEILAEYAARDSRIKVITQENAGLSAARNTALEYATGEWVTGVDSDDYLEPCIYERAMQSVAAGVDLAFFGVRDVDEEGDDIPANPYFNLPAAGVYEMTPELAGQLNACFWSKLWRRSLIAENKLRFPHGLVHEDEAFHFLAAPQVKRVAVCSAVGYYYVQRAGSIMNGDCVTPGQRLLRYEPVVHFVCGEYKKRGWLDILRKAYLGQFMLRVAAYAYWLREDARMAELAAAYGRIVSRFSLGVFDYRLERLIQGNWFTRLFVCRYPGSRVYRFFGVPVYAALFDDAGKRVGAEWMLLSRIKGLFFR